MQSMTLHSSSKRNEWTGGHALALPFVCRRELSARSTSLTRPYFARGTAGTHTAAEQAKVRSGAHRG
jgi:hypothetical protein